MQEKFLKENLYLSTEKARSFARIVYADIARYCDENMVDFQKWQAAQKLYEKENFESDKKEIICSVSSVGDS